MALVLADRVRETTTTTGTGTVTLAGAYTGFQTFSAGVGNTNSTYYTIASVSLGEWEVGIGTYTTSGNTLSRTTVLASSNAGGLVNFSAGTKDAFVTQPAERALYIASAGTGLESKVTAFTNGGIVYASSTSALATGSALVFDGSNLGLGVTPSAWFSLQRNIQIGGVFSGSPYAGALAAQTNDNVVTLFNNAYVNTSNVETYYSSVSSTAAKYKINRSVHEWHIAGNGTAGNAINFTQAMTLDASGNLGIGITSPVGRLNVKSTYVSDTTTQQRFEDNTGVSLNFGGTGGGKKFIQAQDTAGAATYYDVLINPLGGNLGVGTSSPGAILDIRKSASGTVGPTLSLINSATAAVGNAVDINMAGNPGGGALSPTGRIRLTEASAAASTMSFWTYDGTTFAARMNLDPSGNLGLGVTPSAWDSTFKALESGSGSLNGGSFFVQNNGDYTASIATNLYYNAGWKYKNTASSGRYEVYQNNHIWYNAPSGTAGTAITFTQAMTLDSSGNLLVGTTSDLGAKFNVSSGTRAWAGWFQQVNSAGNSVVMVEYSTGAPNNTSDYFALLRDNAAQRIQLRSNGGIGNFSANDVNLSDRREKTNFAPAGEYLSKICAIPVQTFNYIDQSEDDPGLTLGVVAQDVQAVAPELVMESNWGTEDDPKMRLSIYQTDLQYALMKCIQELKAEIDSLKSQLNGA